MTLAKPNFDLHENEERDLVHLTICPTLNNLTKLSTHIEVLALLHKHARNGRQSQGGRCGRGGAYQEPRR